MELYRSTPVAMTAEERKRRDRDRKRAWRAANPEENYRRCRAWAKANPDKIKEQTARHRAKPGTKEKMQKYSREHFIRNREKRREQNLAWHRNNKEASVRLAHKAFAKRPVKILFYAMHDNKKFGPVTIPLEELETLAAPMICSVTGIALNTKKRSPWKLSFDRIDCAKGYVPGNVRVVCWAYNRARYTWPDEIMLEMARAIVARNPAA